MGKKRGGKKKKGGRGGGGGGGSGGGGSSGGGGQAHSVDALVAKGSEALAGENRELALQFYERALAAGGASDVALLDHVAELQAEVGDFESARATLRQRLAVDEDATGRVWMLLGQLLQNMDAVQCYERGIELLKAEHEALANALAAGAGAEGGAGGAQGGGGTREEMVRRQGETRVELSQAYCTVAELFMTDLCYEEDAEAQCEGSVGMALEADPEGPEPAQMLASLRLNQVRFEGRAVEAGGGAGNVKGKWVVFSGVVGGY
jgi:tetratricopeptide (TPR) repeat protein